MNYEEKEPIPADPKNPSVASVAVGVAMIAGDAIRSRANEWLTWTKGQKDQGLGVVRAATHAANQRGRSTVDGNRDGAAILIDATIVGTVGWAQTIVVPRIVDSLLRGAVIPALINDLAHDPRIQELILTECRNAMTEVVEATNAHAARSNGHAQATPKRVIKRPSAKSTMLTNADGLGVS